MKQIYKDNLNDKNSLKIKHEHYEHRRKQKLELVRAEREKLIEEPKAYYKPTETLNRTVVR